MFINTLSIDQFKTEQTCETVTSLNVVTITESWDFSTNGSSWIVSIGTDETVSGIFWISDLAVRNIGNYWLWNAFVGWCKFISCDACNTSSAGEFIGAAVQVHRLAGITWDNVTRDTGHTNWALLFGTERNRGDIGLGWLRNCNGWCLCIDCNIDILGMRVWIWWRVGIGSVIGGWSTIYLVIRSDYSCGCCGSLLMVNG